MGDTPKQIDDVVGIDRMDALDRQKLDPRIKLQLLAAETKNKYSRDPRSGGFAFVARPRVIIQLLIDMNVGPFSTDIRLHKPIVIGVKDGDLVGWWQDVPLLVRCTVVDDNLHCLPLEKIPDSIMPDRQTAGQLRMNAHNGTLLRLREEG
jgi:hypothetical protein